MEQLVYVDASSKPDVGIIEFTAEGKDGRSSKIIMKSTGEFIVNGRLVENDTDLYHGFTKFLFDAGCIMDEEKGKE